MIANKVYYIKQEEVSLYNNEIFQWLKPDVFYLKKNWLYKIQSFMSINLWVSKKTAFSKSL
jgi:hypothetical protein